MFSQSVIVGFFVYLWNVIKKGFSESLIVNFFSSIGTQCTAAVRESAFYNWGIKDVFTHKYYENSQIYNFLNFILEAVLKLTRKIQVFVRRVMHDSVTLRVFDCIFSSKYLSVDFVLAVFIALMFVAPHEMWNNLYAFLGAMLLAFWIFMRVASGKIKSRNARGINISIIGFIIAIVVSTVTAIRFSDALRIGLFMIASVLLTYSVYASLDTKEKLMRFLKVVLFAISITALIGIMQRISGIEVDEEFVDLATNEGMPGRVFSTFSNPNNFAELLILFMPFFVPLLVFVKKWWEKGLVLAGFALSVTALVMTYSRSSWVGFALSVVLFVILYDKRLILPLVMVSVAAIPFLPDSVMNRIFTIGSMKDSSNSYRLYIWDSSLKMIKDYGAVGLGLGPASFKVIYTAYANQMAITAPHSHMLYMEIVLEMGILGFLTFFGYIYSVIKKTTSSMRSMDKSIKCVAIAALSSLLGIAFVCCAEYIWFYPRVMFAFWVVPGIMLAAAKIAKN